MGDRDASSAPSGGPVLQDRCQAPIPTVVLFCRRLGTAQIAVDDLDGRGDRVCRRVGGAQQAAVMLED